ncbi:MAG: endonuclease/exonuclease/phosphatase family protein [Christensenellales bacterium]
MKNKTAKIIAIIMSAIFALFILTVIGYVIYVVCQYDRIEDNLVVSTTNNQTRQVEQYGVYTIVTYNIGFGAYTQDFDFFMDSGEMLDGTKVNGNGSTAKDKETVLTNTNGAISSVADGDYDFMMFQEVDTDSTRSHHVNQYFMLSEAFGTNRASAYACNFHSAYLLYPFHDPHGQSNAGIATYSKYNISSNVRRQYPVDTGFGKFFDLDRCFLITSLPLSNGKYLTLINSHMSAYDKGGTIRAQQLALLNRVLAEEAEKGNYVVVGGDFNHDIADSINLFKTEQKVPEWVYQLTNDDLTGGYKFAAANNVPTCRSTDMPYTKDVNYTVVVDGFIVSDNIEVKWVKNIDTDFMYSDHNPAAMSFMLK